MNKKRSDNFESRAEQPILILQRQLELSAFL